MLPNELESEVSRFITHVQFIWATILVSFNFLMVISLVSSYQRKTRIFIVTFLLLCPFNQSIEQSKRNTDGVELPLRHMKYYITSGTLMELIKGPTTDNRPMCLFTFFFMHEDILATEHIYWQDSPNKRPKQSSSIFCRKTTFAASTRAFADEPTAANETFLALCHRSTLRSIG